MAPQFEPKIRMCGVQELVLGCALSIWKRQMGLSVHAKHLFKCIATRKDEQKYKCAAMVGGGGLAYDVEEISLWD